MGDILYRNRKIDLTCVLVFIVLFCTYIFPLGLLDKTYVASKMIFLSAVAIYSLFNIKKIKIFEFIFVALLVFLSFLLSNYSYLTFASIPIARIVISNKESVLNYLKKSNVLYICLACTLVYSLIWFGEDGRYAFSAIREINQSGLAIFCLGALLLKKNRNVGLFVLAFGFLTFSRSYLLAVLLLFLSSTKLYSHFFRKWFLKIFSYFNITLLSSIAFVALGFFYIWQYRLGNIYYSPDLSTKFDLLDYSNFFRFTAILRILYIFANYPLKLFTGISTGEYIAYGSDFSRVNAIPFKETVPHNLFFSHLKIYGIISIIETIYVSKILKTIVNKKNLMIFIAIALYSIILGAGLYSYWLYLSIFTLLVHGEIGVASVEDATKEGKNNKG